MKKVFSGLLTPKLLKNFPEKYSKRFDRDITIRSLVDAYSSEYKEISDTERYELFKLLFENGIDFMEIEMTFVEYCQKNHLPNRYINDTKYAYIKLLTFMFKEGK